MTRPGQSPFPWIPAAVAAASWVVCAGGFGLLTWFGLVPNAFVKHLLPETIPRSVGPSRTSLKSCRCQTIGSVDDPLLTSSSRVFLAGSERSSVVGLVFESRS